MKLSCVLPVFPLILMIGCGDSPSGTGKAAGEKRISINSTDRFQGDLNEIFPPDVARLLQAGPISRDRAGAAGKTSALIDFDEAKVLILWWDFQKIIENPLYYMDTVALCEQEVAIARAFEGKNPLKFDDLVSGFSQYPYMSVAYSGTLEKSGSYVEGTITVKPGINNALVCFIKDGKVTWASSGLYLYISGLYGGSTSSLIEDGWLMTWDPYHNDSTAFTSMQISLSPEGIAWYPVTSFMSGTPDMMIGATEAWVRQYSMSCN